MHLQSAMASLLSVFGTGADVQQWTLESLMGLGNANPVICTVDKWSVRRVQVQGMIRFMPRFDAGVSITIYGRDRCAKEQTALVTSLLICLTGICICKIAIVWIVACTGQLG